MVVWARPSRIIRSQVLSLGTATVLGFALVAFSLERVVNPRLRRR